MPMQTGKLEIQAATNNTIAPVANRRPADPQKRTPIWLTSLSAGQGSAYVYLHLQAVWRCIPTFVEGSRVSLISLPNPIGRRKTPWPCNV